MSRKAPRTVHFTKANIASLETPRDYRLYHYDQNTPGLAVCVTPAGSKTFYVVRRIDDVVERVRIGPWPETTVEQARTKAAEINGSVAAGINPNDKRRVNRQAPTLGQVFDEYIETPTRGKAKRARSPKTLKEYRWQFKAHLEAWRDRQLSKIKRSDVEKLHNDIGKENGEYLANRVLALLKACLNYAVEQEYYPLNVSARIRGYQEQARDRFLTAAEMPAFWAAVESEAAADFFKLSLLTGARQANVLACRWDQLDLVAGLWNIPKTKGGQPLTVPLSPQAIELLKLRQSTTKSEWVFTRGDGITGPMPSPRNGWTRILKRAGIDGLRMHDLRRSLASWQAGTGASETVIGKTLGHASIQATKIYAHADLNAVRESVNAATAAILAAANPAKPVKAAKRSK